MQSAKFRYVPQTEMSAFPKGEEVFFENTDMDPNAVNAPEYPFGIEQIKDAEARLVRFAPLIEKAFPETAPRHGIIESELKAVPNYQKQLLKRGGCSEAVPAGSLFIKADSELPVAGSVKARGGIYEVLKHTEKLALEHGLITTDSDYSTLLEKREFFSKYKIQVGSTGNLGLSIGIASAALGYDVTVHMSADAKQWKKICCAKRVLTLLNIKRTIPRLCGRAGNFPMRTRRATLLMTRIRSIFSWAMQLPHCGCELSFRRTE